MRQRTFTIVTTRANEVMQPIHDRMPVILSEDAADAWLNPAENEPAHLKKPRSPPDDLLVYAPARPSSTARRTTTGDCWRRGRRVVGRGKTSRRIGPTPPAPFAGVSQRSTRLDRAARGARGRLPWRTPARSPAPLQPPRPLGITLTQAEHPDARRDHHEPAGDEPSTMCVPRRTGAMNVYSIVPSHRSQLIISLTVWNTTAKGSARPARRSPGRG
ncbi:MAG: SOS response-associated peptidase family protein [Dehalococcoidia bacterium]|nr:SOS response-associated peptidase family protein [Dehalococcoidia bacterium]